MLIKGLLLSTLAGFALGAALPAASAECPRPEDFRVTGITTDKSTIKGGGGDSFTLTVNFNTVLPRGCTLPFSLSYSPAIAIANSGASTLYIQGHDTSTYTSRHEGNGVDVDTPVTITARSMVGNVAQNDQRVTQVVVTARPLASMSLDQDRIRFNGTGRGRVKIGDGTGGFTGTVTVQLSASPAGLVDIPSSIRVGEETTPLSPGSTSVTEYVRTFTIKPRGRVIRPTPVVITATRLGVSFSQTVILEPMSTQLINPPPTPPTIVPGRVTPPAGN